MLWRESGLYTQSLQKYLKETLGYGADQSAAFFFVITIPWMIKPLYGLLSDFLPIFGQRRKSYFILSSLLAIVAMGMMVLWKPTSVTLPILFFVVGIGIAFSDVLSDAVMVEKGQPLQATDRLQAAQWGAFWGAGIIVAFCKGYIAEFFTLGESLALTCVFPGLVIVLTILMLRERRVASSRESARQSWEGLKMAARSRPLWGAAIFIFLFQCSPSLGTVLYFYEKDTLKFDDVLIGHIDSVGNLCGLAGALLFGTVSKWMSHETMVRVMILAGTLSGLVYLFFLGEASAYWVTAFAWLIGMLPFMGTLVIAAQVCPKHAEGSSFALIMAISNLGTRAGDVLGGSLYGNPHIGYRGLVIISSVLTAAMWFFIPLVRRLPPAEAASSQ